MTGEKKRFLLKAPLVAVLSLAACVVLGAGSAWAKYANDGAVQNATGGWDIDSGFCNLNPGETTKPDCRSVIYSRNGAQDPLYNTQALCQAAGHQWNSGFTCTNYWYVGHYPYTDPDPCINPAAHYDADYIAEHGAPGVWDDQICRGNWQWVGTYPASSAADYRETCLRCHNDKYYAEYPERQQDSYLMTGHKNMGRPVVTVSDAHYTAGAPWSGADGNEYATDSSGNVINWTTGEITVGGTDRQLYWIYDGWIAATPRAAYFTPANVGTGKPGLSYSCGRCHMTGWTSDAVLQSSKEPETSFPGITWDGVSVAVDGQVNLAGGVTGDTNPMSSWDQWGIQCSRCHGSQIRTDRLCEDLVTPCTSNANCTAIGSGVCLDLKHHPNTAVGKEITGNLATGATQTSLCMDCHRQESGGLPYGLCEDGTTVCTVDTACVGIGGGTCTTAPTVLKVGDAHGTTDFVSHWHGDLFLNSPHGRFSGTFDQINDKTLYDTHFKNEGESFPFQGNQGGCPQCHNVHKSTVAAANPAGEAIHEECTDCHAKSLGAVMHPAGGGTPLEHMATEPAEACVSCHMPEGYHLFRINTSASYSTIPDRPADQPSCVAAGGTWNAGTSKCTLWNAGTAVDDGYANAVWVDVDHACGQCHGGGTNAVDNPPTDGAAYLTKVQLAGYAEGMHNDKPTVTFSTKLASPDTLTVSVNASGTACSGTCNVYAWDWGDATPAGSGQIASHTYAAAGSYTITLTVTEYGVNSASKSKTVTVYTPDQPPTVAGTCTFNANTWTATVTDASTDDNGIGQVTVNWGDGGMLSSDKTAPFGPFTHTFLKPGTFTIARKAIDTIGQQAVDTTCTASPAYFTIGGAVFASDTVTPVIRAKVQVKLGATTVRTVYTAPNGVFAAGSLKPGTYTLTVTKPGYTFTVPAATTTVGPDQFGSIFATSP